MDSYFKDQQAVFFKDRTSAGKYLARFFNHLSGKDTVVYALPRGGVIVGAEIAKALHAPLDLIITRKIGHPNQPEYAIGAVAEDGHAVFNKDEILKIDEQYITEEAEKQKQEAKRRRKVYLGAKKPISCKGKTAIIIDDGIATGLTVKAAVKELKIHYSPKRIIVVTPVAPRDVVNELEQEGVELLSVITIKDFLGSVGSYYLKFPPVSDDEVIETMKEVEKNKYIFHPNSVI